jgi:putative redox protein
MGVKMRGVFTGGKAIEILHEDSGVRIVTDAPRDNGGEGLSFSPTDLVGAALGSCVATTIVLYAERSGIELYGGVSFEVEKVMGSDPRRISELLMTVHLSARLSEEERVRLERAGMSCPVHKSLHPESVVRARFVYDLE